MGSRTRPNFLIWPFSEARYFAVHLDPRQRVITKNLPPWFGDGRLIKRPDIQNNKARPRSRLLGDRRAAFGAEVPEDRIAAAADAAEGFQCALDSWVDFGFIAYRAAEATASNFHLDPLVLLPFRLNPKECCPHRASPMAKTSFFVSRLEPAQKTVTS